MVPALPLLLALLAASPVPLEPPVKRVGFLVLPGLYTGELIAPFEVFYQIRFHSMEAPDVFTVGMQPDALTTFEGLELTPHYTLENAPPIDLLVVPSAGSEVPRSGAEEEAEEGLESDPEVQAARVLSWVRRRASRAVLLLSLRDGAFLLAEAGLLDGREATTFPADQPRFAKAFPQVRLRRQAMFVHDGKVVTSVGGARSYAAALYLVEQLYGRRVARGVAESLVLDWSPGVVPYRRAPGALLPPTPKRR